MFALQLTGLAGRGYRNVGFRAFSVLFADETTDDRGVQTPHCSALGCDICQSPQLFILCFVCPHTGGSAFLSLSQALVSRKQQNMFLFVVCCRWKRDGSGTEIAHLVTDKSILKLHSTLYCNSFQILLCDCRVAQCHEVLEQFSSWSFLPLHICALSAHFVLHHPLPGPLRKAE